MSFDGKIEQIIIYMAIWDDNYGPKIISEYPSSKNLDLSEIADKIFLSFQTIFGDSSDVSFDRTNLILPLKSQKKIAKILLDSVPNPKVRGGLQPFIAVALSPICFPEEQLHIFNATQEKMILSYQENHKIELKKYYPEFVCSTEKLANEIDSNAGVLFKKKNYEDAIKSYETAWNLMQIARNKSKASKFLSKLNKSRIKRAEQLLKSGLDNNEFRRFEISDNELHSGMELADLAYNSSLIKKFRKALKKNYVSWARSVEILGDEASHKRDYNQANKMYSKAVNLAKKGQHSRLVNRFNKKLGKTPHLRALAEENNDSK